MTKQTVIDFLKCVGIGILAVAVSTVLFMTKAIFVILCLIFLWLVGVLTKAIWKDVKHGIF